MEDDGLDPDIIEQMVDAFEIDIIDSDEPQEVGVPKVLDNADDIALDKGETLLKTDIPPISTLQREDESLSKIIEAVNQKMKSKGILQYSMNYHIT